MRSGPNLLTAVGITGFVLAGRKVWWCWYINIACQGLWLAYALVTRQYGFIAAAALYTVVFTRNAISWTREHRERNVVFLDWEYEKTVGEPVVWEGDQA